MDMNSSDLVVTAQLAERRRELASLARRPPRRERHRQSLSAIIAGGLAHVAYHINRRALGDVAARHLHQAGRS